MTPKYAKNGNPGNQRKVNTLKSYRLLRSINWNLNREGLKDDQGNVRLRITYPKFKEGEGKVREARVKQNYGDSFSLKLFVSLPMKKGCS